MSAGIPGIETGLETDFSWPEAPVVNHKIEIDQQFEPIIEGADNKANHTYQLLTPNGYDLNIRFSPTTQSERPSRGMYNPAGRIIVPDDSALHVTRNALSVQVQPSLERVPRLNRREELRLQKQLAALALMQAPERELKMINMFYAASVIRSIRQRLTMELEVADALYTSGVRYFPDNQQTMFFENFRQYGPKALDDVTPPVLTGRGIKLNLEQIGIGQPVSSAVFKWKESGGNTEQWGLPIYDISSLSIEGGK